MDRFTFQTVGTTNWRLSGTHTYTGATVIEAFLNEDIPGREP